MTPPTSLDRILREQRAAAATLPAPGAVLGVSDWLAEEVLLASDPVSGIGPQPNPAGERAETAIEPAIAGEDGGAWCTPGVLPQHAPRPHHPGRHHHATAEQGGKPVRTHE